MHVINYTIAAIYIILEVAMPKKTRLDDDALIYQKQEQKSEKEKLKEMTLPQKISYLWEYYRYPALAVIAAIALISYIIYSMAKPKTATILEVAIINNTIEHEVWDEYAQKVSKYLDADPEREEVKLDYSYYFNGTSDYAANMRQLITLRLASAEVDAIIAPLSEFASYLDYGAFAPLSDLLPTDLYSSLTSKFFLTATEDNPKVDAYGIYVSDTKLYRENSFVSDENDPIILGITVNSKHKETTIDFIRLLFGEK